MSFGRFFIHLSVVTLYPPLQQFTLLGGYHEKVSKMSKQALCEKRLCQQKSTP